MAWSENNYVVNKNRKMTSLKSDTEDYVYIPCKRLNFHSLTTTEGWNLLDSMRLKYILKYIYMKEISKYEKKKLKINQNTRKQEKDENT